MEGMGWGREVGVRLGRGRRISAGGRRSAAWPGLVLRVGRRRDELDMVEGEMADGRVCERTGERGESGRRVPSDAVQVKRVERGRRPEGKEGGMDVGWDSVPAERGRILEDEIKDGQAELAEEGGEDARRSGEKPVGAVEGVAEGKVAGRGGRNGREEGWLGGRERRKEGAVDDGEAVDVGGDVGGGSEETQEACTGLVVVLGSRRERL